MIVGTAGHIDHGKTRLVGALTGVDTDRLPEEKARGISIELGYAFLAIPDSAPADRIGFIDVPGHERLVHTMISGATGIDFALLLVAADDGVMPQTREHLAVLSLLGIERGAVALTKIDRVDPDRVSQVSGEVRALLGGTGLASAPIFPVAAPTGDGVAALREHLFAAARAMPAPEASDGRAFRLAVDRVFTLDGVGTVVTGTVHAGRVRVGDELALVPSGRRARVRSVHAQNQAVESGWAGQRCALGLVGLSKDEVARGQWLVDPDVALESVRIDLGFRLWPDTPKPLRSGTPVHVHLGSATAQGSVAVLGAEGAAASAEVLAPGQAGRVQVVLQAPVGAWRGDRVILRDGSASRTLGGGRVLDPSAPARYRRTPQRLAELDALALATPTARLQGLVDARREGLCLAGWSRAEGFSANALPPVPRDALSANDPDGQLCLLGAEHAAAATDALLGALASFHAREPEMLGPDAARLRRLSVPRLPDPLWRALLRRLQDEGRVAVRGSFVHLPAHEARLSATEERLAQKILPLVGLGGFEGRWARDIARDLGESEALVRLTLARLAGRGELHQVVKDLCFDTPTITQLAAIARQVAEADGKLTAAAFRDASGLGRKRAIQLLEYFDRVGLLRRVGDEHRLRTDTQIFTRT